MDRGNFKLLAGVLLGAGIMALLDPSHGKRRRAWVRDKMFRGGHFAGRMANRQAKRVRNEAFGAIAETKARMFEGKIPDEVLEERVKAQIGHVLSHSSVEVKARDGHIIIAGPVLRGERKKLEDRLRETRGVHSWELHVKEHETDEGLPGLRRASRPQRQKVV